MIWFYYQDGNRKYYFEVQRASKLVLSDGLYCVCLSREALVDIFLFKDKRYVARGSIKFYCDTPRIYNLYTVPAERGRGFASVILQKCIDIARENRYNSIDAIVRKNNRGSIALHKKFRFKRMKYDQKKCRFYLEIKDAP